MKGVSLYEAATWLNMDFSNEYANPFGSTGHNDEEYIYIFADDVSDSGYLCGEEGVPTLILSGITEIKPYAFYGVDAFSIINSQTFGSGTVTKVGKYAFSNCDSLTTALVPDLDSDIVPEGMFADCSNLSSVEISEDKIK